MTTQRLLAVLVGAAILATGARGTSSDSSAAGPARPLARLTSSQLIGQLSIASFQGGTPNAGLIERIRRGELAGIIFYASNITTRSRLAQTVRMLQAIPRPAAVRAPLLMMLDQEGGEVKRIPGPPDMSAAQMGRTGSAGVAFAQGHAAGRNLRAAGINVDVAPVADVAAPAGIEERQMRAFGRNPATVARLASAFARGVRSAGPAAMAKHFPGQGMLADDADVRLQRVRLSAAALRRVDEAPFAATIAAGVEMVMVGNVVYTAFDPQPALLSRAIVTGELRHRLGFRGVIVSDTLTTPALAAFGSPSHAGELALASGVDLLMLHADDATIAATLDAIAADLGRGSLPRAQLERSVSRVLALRERLSGNG